jgi:hypothetical protein
MINRAEERGVTASTDDRHRYDARRINASGCQRSGTDVLGVGGQGCDPNRIAGSGMCCACDRRASQGGRAVRKNIAKGLRRSRIG